MKLVAPIGLAVLLVGCAVAEDAADDETVASDGKGDDGLEPCLDLEAWDAERAAYEAEVLRLTNLQRVAGAACGGVAYRGQPALRANGKLRCAARRHSADMVARDFFAHVNPDGDSPTDRIAAEGYDGYATGENIALGHATPAEVVDGWMASPGHCRNIMHDSYRDLGVGYHPGEVLLDGTRYTHAWSQAFGALY